MLQKSRTQRYVFSYWIINPFIEGSADVGLTGYKYHAPTEPPPDVDDEIRRKEEEELQRVLELSAKDTGRQWEEYTLASSETTGPKQGQSSSQPYRAPPAESGYVPTSAVPPQVHTQTNTATAQRHPAQEPVSPANPAPATLVTRVRALHSFEPTETGELAFERGDIIRVVDRGYKDWWRGQLRGRTGIFPVNYVVSKSDGCTIWIPWVLIIPSGIVARSDSC